MEIIFNNVDIVIFFFITILIIHRLYLVLGTRQGHHVDINKTRYAKQNTEDEDIKPLEQVKEEVLNIKIQDEINLDSGSAKSTYKKMLYLEKIFSDFEYVEFIKKRQDDFLTIIASYHSKTLSNVKNKLSQHYFNTLEKASLNNEEDERFSLNEFKEVDIKDIDFKEDEAIVCVKFITSYKILASDNSVVEEDDSNTEYWFFSRSYKNTKWVLFNIKNEYN